MKIPVNTPEELEQVKLLKEIQEKGYNVVTCGNCPTVFLHRTGVNEVTCPVCKMTQDTSDCPDLWY